VRRRPTAELLDTDSGTPAEVAGSIADLRMFNRWFGGVSTTRSLIQSVACKIGKSEFSLLEVAAGDGFLAQAVSASLRPRGIRLQVTLLDRAQSHLPVFANSSNNGNRPSGNARVGRTLLSDAFDVGVAVDLQTQNKNQDQKRRTRMSDPHESGAFSSALVADALNLPFPDSTFDLVSCSLFVHHLSPEQVTQFARESLRVCCQAVLVNDLIRDPLHLALVYAGMPLYRSRLTRHDAPASVRQAYTIKEMRKVFQQSGAASVEVRGHYLYRMGVIAWKKMAKGNPPA
jgi:ubiquinone/menaquinone biosynthesis C-methylase UbiE